MQCMIGNFSIFLSQIAVSATTFVCLCCNVVESVQVVGKIGIDLSDVTISSLLKAIHEHLVFSK